LPWHRGYVLALEEEVRAAIVAAGGPKDWALPYWNYFRDPAIPPAFAQVWMPDGRPNPLHVRARFGPAGDGVVRIPAGKINAAAMRLVSFTGTPNASPGFGGLDTGFSHSGAVSGALESQPHNVVHDLIGGRGVLDGKLVGGVMADPRTAGLDPVFWLHHANIDRMWAAWNAAGKRNPSEPTWLEGPVTRRFALPRLSGKIEEFQPRDMVRIDVLGYGYDSLDVGAADVVSKPREAAAAPGEEGRAAVESHAELVGANAAPLALDADGGQDVVRLQPVVATVAARLAGAEGSTAEPVERLFLNLEGVRANEDAIVLDVYVGLPAGAVPADHPDLLAGSIGLFGTQAATDLDGPHGGQGLTHVLDVTDVVANLRRSDSLDPRELTVTIVPMTPLEPGDDVSVSRISVFREGPQAGDVR
jgi:tyrosinase